MDVGPLIATGRTAEVFALGDDRVVKVPRPGFEGIVDAELRIGRLVAAVYPGAPRCDGPIAFGDRRGLIYERIEGPAMDDLVRREPWRIDALGRTLGGLQAEMHAVSGSGLPDQARRLRNALELARGTVGAAAADAARVRIEELPSGSALCHGDLHPGNVLLGKRPAVIDWENACMGAPEADVARTIYLVADTPMDVETWPIIGLLAAAVRRRFLARALAAYRARRALDDTLVRAWRLPILVARAAEGIVEERPILLRLIEAELQRGRSRPPAPVVSCD